MTCCLNACRAARLGAQRDGARRAAVSRGVPQTLARLLQPRVGQGRAAERAHARPLARCPRMPRLVGHFAPAPSVPADTGVSRTRKRDPWHRSVRRTPRGTGRDCRTSPEIVGAARSARSLRTYRKPRARPDPPPRPPVAGACRAADREVLAPRAQPTVTRAPAECIMSQSTTSPASCAAAVIAGRRSATAPRAVSRDVRRQSARPLAVRRRALRVAHQHAQRPGPGRCGQAGQHVPVGGDVVGVGTITRRYVPAGIPRVATQRVQVDTRRSRASTTSPGRARRYLRSRHPPAAQLDPRSQPLMKSSAPNSTSNRLPRSARCPGWANPSAAQRVAGR